MSHNIELKEGGVIISDAHYSSLRPELLSLINDIDQRIVPATQLILMGDIFDALFGEVPYTHRKNQEIISLINKISENIEVIYLEGNHDFNLCELFPLAQVFPIQTQPVLCTYSDKKVYLAHGDFDGEFLYKSYTKLIRNSSILFVLNLFDTLLNHYILKKLDKYLSKKDDCKEFIGFQKFIQNRIEDKYECDYFIEGHFHQNIALKLQGFSYLNLPAFACNQRYFIVKSLQDKQLFEERNSHKEI